MDCGRLGLGISFGVCIWDWIWVDGARAVLAFVGGEPSEAVAGEYFVEKIDHRAHGPPAGPGDAEPFAHGVHGLADGFGAGGDGAVGGAGVQ